VKRRKEKGERRKEKGERRKEKGERRKEKGNYSLFPLPGEYLPSGCKDFIKSPVGVMMRGGYFSNRHEASITQYMLY
jgi:hypothetical protein